LAGDALLRRRCVAACFLPRLRLAFTAHDVRGVGEWVHARDVRPAVILVVIRGHVGNGAFVCLHSCLGS
jgi:hypothetical protein